MTSGWFITLSEMLNKRELPIQLFSVDRCFRREQREDATRLQCYNSASCVIMDEDVGVDNGKAISESLLAQFGFEDFRFRLDKKRSKYYIPGTQTEVFAYHPALVGSNTKYSDGWVEIATFGIYSPTALAQYNIPYPVMNLGLGVERLAIIIYNSKDLRELVYPQFYREELSDGEISRGLYLKETPKTDQGLKLANSIKDACARYGTEKSPCKFFVWRGEIYGRRIEVNIVEPEENTKLCGPAYINKIIVKDGNILAVPEDSEAIKGGTDTGITFSDAFSQLAASRIENLLAYGNFDEEERKVKVRAVKSRVRAVKTLGDINIGVKEHVHRYITSKKKKIDVRGPVFTTIETEVIE
jgi:O-phosphoseryl-tRNA synthetase